jgi:3-oxoacyl-[acyl-carrier protein] reductase
VSAQRFEGRVAIVTGGSRGIGRAVSRRLAEEGAVVYGVYLRDTASADSLRELFPERFVPVQADVCASEAMGGVVSRAVSEAGRLDILVNCAGGPVDGLLLRADSEKIRSAIRLNLDSTIEACRAALPPMLTQRYGRILNFSSVVAAGGNAGQAVYAASKAGVEGFTRSLAREVGARGITVNCISPGLIETEMTEAMPAEIRERAVSGSALGRSGTAEEAAAPATFLVSEEASYVTGAVLQVNGGLYM